MTEGPSSGACLDCKRRYGDEYGFSDLHVSDEVWEAINPGSDGAGLLCPSCICARAHAAGLTNVVAQFTSGPFATYATRFVIATCEDCGWQSAIPQVGSYWVCECPEAGRAHRMKEPPTQKAA